MNVAAKYFQQPREANGRLKSVPIEMRFNASIKAMPSGCVEWQRPVNKGYGEIIYNGKLYKAHHIALMLRGVEIPPDKEVCHTCDNPKCVNWEHLEIATHKKNMDDAVARGLWNPKAGWETMMQKRHVRFGENQKQHKLTLEQVSYIRSLSYRRGLYMELAKQFGVSSETIAQAYKGKTWQKGNSIIVGGVS